MILGIYQNDGENLSPLWFTHLDENGNPNLRQTSLGESLSGQLLNFLEKYGRVNFGLQHLSLDVNGMGVVHRITMISNVAKYLSIFFQGLRSFVLCLFCPKRPNMQYGPILKGNKWNTLGGASVIYVCPFSCLFIMKLDQNYFRCFSHTNPNSNMV